MPFAIEQKYLAIGKEGTRGTAVAPTKYIPVMRDSEFDYKLNLIPDELVRGIFEQFPAKAGTKEGLGKISGLDIYGNNIGEFLYSLMGSETLSPLAGAKTYTHTMKKDSTIGLLNPSYTIHINRGMGSKQYNLSVVKSIAFKGTVDGKVTADVEFLFQTEDDEAFTLTPTWIDPTPMMFFNTTVSFDNTPDVVAVKDWNLTIDNGSVAHRVLNQSQDIKDVLTIGKLVISGSMNIYFEDETRRQNFLSATSQGITIAITGGQIEAGQNYGLTFTIPKAMYTACPFGELDGLLGAAVTFTGHYDVAAGKSLSIALKNDDSAYSVASSPTITSLDVTDGPDTGGTAITITGTGFLSGATVTFNGAYATNVVVVSGTEITCDTPPGVAGDALVIVRNTNTAAGYKVDGFTYISAPTITSLSVSSGTTAGGTNTQINGTDFHAGATVTFGGTSATNIVVVSSTAITCTTPAHAGGAVNVVVTNTDTGTVTGTGAYTYV